MTARKNSLQVIKKGLLKSTIVGLGIFLFLFVSIFTFIATPYFQTKFVQKLVTRISDHTDFKISVGYINLAWFDSPYLENLTVYDSQDSLMLAVKKMDIDLDLWSVLFGEREIRLNYVGLDNVQINVIKPVSGSAYNIDLFAYQIKNYLSSGKKRTITLLVDEIDLNNAQFSFNNQAKDSIKTYFDYRHFKIDQIDGRFETFRNKADTFEMQIIQIVGNSASNKLKIKDLRSFFRVSNTSLEWQGLYLALGNTIIRDTVIFKFNKRSNLSFLKDSVEILANFNQSQISLQDLAHFTPGLSKYNEYFQLNGKFRGKISEFSIDEFDLQFGKNSQLIGKVNFDGLPKLEETYMKLIFNQSKLDPSDLKQYIGESRFQAIEKFGLVKFNGKMTGFFNDFVTQARFETDLGEIDTDINLKIGPKPEDSKYSGIVRTTEFDAGRLIDKPGLFQEMNMKGSIEGKGFTLEAADFYLNAYFEKLTVRGYPYQNISTNSHLAKQLFQGTLSISDPNLKMVAKASIDLRGGKDRILVKGRLDTAFVKKLNIYSEDIFVSSDFMIDTYGLDLDNVVGHAMFKNTLIKLKDRELWVDSAEVSSSIRGNKRTFIWNSERFNLSMQGTFQFATIIKDFKRLAHEYKLNLENNKSEIAAYYRDYQQNDLQKYNIDFRAYLNDINPLLNLTTSGLYISPGAIIEGEIRGGYTTILMVNSVIDSLKYKNYNFYNNQIDISTSKIADSTNVLASVIIESEYQKFGERSNTDNLYIEGIWDKDSIVFETYLEQKQTGNFAQLKGRFNFRENQTDLRFEPSRFKVLERHWEFSPTNIITFAN
ncbi:MAG: hypothetical protein O6848_01030, partial [Bacteroidetes bacterium]|nr:hypothetical protein [Bacteroidota bacterium]